MAHYMESFTFSYLQILQQDALYAKEIDSHELVSGSFMGQDWEHGCVVFSLEASPCILLCRCKLNEEAFIYVRIYKREKCG
jgi:hypothetical protein